MRFGARRVLRRRRQRVGDAVLLALKFYQDDGSDELSEDLAYAVQWFELVLVGLNALVAGRSYKILRNLLELVPWAEFNKLCGLTAAFVVDATEARWEALRLTAERERFYSDGLWSSGSATVLERGGVPPYIRNAWENAFKSDGILRVLELMTYEEALNARAELARLSEFMEAIDGVRRAVSARKWRRGMTLAAALLSLVAVAVAIYLWVLPLF